jgi:hypothetical protein
MTADMARLAKASLWGVAFTGAGLLWRRPGLLLVWTLVGMPTALFLVFGAKLALAVGSLTIPLVLLVGVALLRAQGAVLAAAAFRAILRPEAGGPAFLGFGAAERRIAFMGFDRNPGGWPMGILLGFMAAMAGVIALLVVVGTMLGLAIAIYTSLAAWAVGVLAFLTVNVRASLSSVAAFIGRHDPQVAGWERGRGRSLSMIGQAIIIAATAAIFVVGIIRIWLGTFIAVFMPSVLFAPGLPQGVEAWTRLGLEGGVLSFAIALSFALINGLWAPAMARTWQVLGGDDEYERRKAVFFAEG